jgi:penicillin amidase
VIRRIAAVASVVAALLLGAGLIGATAFVMAPLPSRRGRIPVRNLQAPVEASFDKRGIPHLRAVLEADAWRALGFIHATDRLFQMEMRRRAAEGRLAEIFGAPAVAMDRQARLQGYAALAARDWEHVRESERVVLEAYADGVNSFLGSHALPLELRMLRLTPEPWTPLDSLAFGRLLQDDLSAAASVERSAFNDARRRGTQAAIALLDASEPGASEVAREIEDLLAGSARTASVFPPPAEMSIAGSNAWALAGTRTASGKPLLAGDPHLAGERPGVWYAAHLTSADGVDVVGLTLAGAPGVIIGHNGRVAWSLTMHQADDSDLFVEQIDLGKGTYKHGDAWLPLDRTTETIHVRDGADVVVEIARTVHGPIVETFDELPGFALSRAFAPAGLLQGPRAFLEASRARSGPELIAAWSHFAGPSVNVCWADTTGAIGVKVAGAIPRRLAGDGRFPVPGWTGAYDWDGTLPAESLPAVAEPKDGIVVTANDDWSSSGRRVPYPGFYAEPDRARRARQLGTAISAARVANMRAMQNDIYSPYAARVVSTLGRSTYADPLAAKAASILAAWNAHADRRGPSRLFYAFMKEARKEAGETSARISWSMLERMIDGTGAQSFWDDPKTARVEARGERIERALARAIQTVERQDGTDPARWSFGKPHRLLYQHPFAEALPAAVASFLAFGPVELPGEWHTLDVAGFPLRGERYDVSEIPSARLIVDLSRPDASRLVLPLGQSGQLFDRHAHDQLRAWSTGRDFPLPFTRKAIEAAAISRIQFVPTD